MLTDVVILWQLYSLLYTVRVEVVHVRRFHLHNFIKVMDKASWAIPVLFWVSYPAVITPYAITEVLWAYHALHLCMSLYFPFSSFFRVIISVVEDQALRSIVIH